jgi:hypothetical protein
MAKTAEEQLLKLDTGVWGAPRFLNDLTSHFSTKINARMSIKNWFMATFNWGA